MAPADPPFILTAAVAGVLGMEEREEAVAIVDPYASGRFLVDELRKRGWPLIAVRSSLDIDEALLRTWNPVPFEHVVVHHGDLAETTQALRARPLRAVIAGSESAPELADALAHALGLRGNVPALSRCRWDKYDMHARLAECGLRACRQKLCASPEEAIAFAEALGTWPLVAKPRASHGGSSIHLCREECALAEAVESIRNARDFANRENVHALVQEFLEGSEYIVDCVSVDGVHYVSAAWSFPKRATETGFAYDFTQMLAYDPTEGSLQQKMYAYIFQCLTALGVLNGASHSEVMYSEETGPCLIEVSTRMHGSMGPPLWAKCAGREQAQPYLVADVYVEGGRLLKQRIEAVRAGGSPYELKQISLQVDLRCPKSGTLKQSLEASAGGWLRKLPTFFSMRFFCEEGDRMAATNDLTTSPGFVVLLGPDSASVERDASAIRGYEAGGKFYILEDLSLRKCSIMSVEGELSFPTAKRARAPSVRLSEMETQAEHLLSPFCSRAGSPQLSPQQAPALPPDMDFVEFSLDGAGMESPSGVEFDLRGFSMDGLPPLEL